MRIGLVLGAGGVTGASYLAGALEGIRRATGFTPIDADVVVGTSAGAFIGAIASLVPIPLLYAQSTGDFSGGRFSPAERDLAARMDGYNQAHFLRRFPPARRIPRPVLASPRAVWKGLLAPRRTTAEMVLTGLLGEGLLSVASAGEIIRTALPAGWPSARLRVATCDLDTGRRVVFGREHAPLVDLHRAVYAAVSIPGLFSPVQIGPHRCVDAGSWSPSNLDLVQGEELDVVLCVLPMAADAAAPGTDPPPGWLGRVVRSRLGRRLAVERAGVERSGCRVFVIQPGPDDRAVMPRNFMAIGPRPRVVRVAAESVERTLLLPELAELREALSRRPSLSARSA